ncbi:hypothetical protein BABINDRAFT_172828 [Babjeviella inositovora NRRL Y-12698]|uniref:DNA-(apurinic or apyrimidinic site) endonuclease 2 n=1 Tax=Babjeviella inositovora NRRL Y-12698 TaxID=984486 RepID=A0A1E3QIG9_9ASCO|nr:uncharacterized protein BABINDRAFT_172828 [Babjeviella inositovora NRRL Y-12698]ODQ77496.1 hypothetical protein BABINDRAFT_172828 [Babjeviella inositovora NRRL Y-12698]
MDPISQIPVKSPHNLRFVTFNINGCRSVLNYHPWNRSKSFDYMFSSLQADVITLQELKIQRSDINHQKGLGSLAGYRCFLTVPHAKRGYSGVGVYVRIPAAHEPEAVRRSLVVIKAEEGITGILQSPDYKPLEYRELPPEKGIGGYPTSNQAWYPRIDSEGRCVVVELACNVVVISLYCPANSMGTTEGGAFRVAFLECVFERVRNLEKLGKQVLVMGDINVSRDLIDSADACFELAKTGAVKKLPEGVYESPCHEGAAFERLNADEVERFRSSTLPKALLNGIVTTAVDIAVDDIVPGKVLYDIARELHGRRLKMFTCWNTLKNARPSNYGSRIDLILTTEQLKRRAVQADILPMLHGSDHCPLFADFSPDTLIMTHNLTSLKFEAKAFYKLQYNGIDAMFGKCNAETVDTSTEVEGILPIMKEEAPFASPECDTTKPLGPPAKRLKLAYVSRKAVVVPKNQKLIASFFTPAKPAAKESLFVEESDDELYEAVTEAAITKPSASSVGSIGSFMAVLGKPPRCKHNEAAVLKTCTNSKSANRGKKFWSCRERSCNFFEWANANQ